MPKVQVQGRDITADDAATVIRDALGDGVRVTTSGYREIDVRRNWFVRAKVHISEESDGTLFSVRGSGPPTPLGLAVMMPVNNSGIAKQVATVIEQHAGFRK
jgi:hypothetical protein